MKTDGQYLLEPVPHTDAVAFIKNKPAVSREVFDKLLPELRGRVFTISGIEDLSVLQRVRDNIAALPAGGDWNTLKKEIAKDLGPWFVDPEADAETRDAQIGAANRRAELLLKTHGFQAYQANQYEVMKATSDVRSFWMYQTVEDDRVRPEHAALNGLILPADSPFWDTHFPPWDWGCRCMVVSLLPEEVSEAEGSGHGFTLSDTLQNRLENQSILDDGSGHNINVASPAAMGKEGAFSWNPGDLRIPLDLLQSRYEPDVWQVFEEWAKSHMIKELGVTVWQWLKGKRA